MSSQGHLLNDAYRKATLAMAEANKDSVIGFITQRALTCDPLWLNLTPGVSLIESKDRLGQQYHSPAQAILENGTDIIIVGRGIVHAADPLGEAKRYREAGWKAYLQKISSSHSLS
jgi:uridine monophosphate synthetase